MEDVENTYYKEEQKIFPERHPETYLIGKNASDYSKNEQNAIDQDRYLMSKVNGNAEESAGKKEIISKILSTDYCFLALMGICKLFSQHIEIDPTFSITFFAGENLSKLQKPKHQVNLRKKIFQNEIKRKAFSKDIIDLIEDKRFSKEETCTQNEFYKEIKNNSFVELLSTIFAGIYNDYKNLNEKPFKDERYQDKPEEEQIEQYFETRKKTGKSLEDFINLVIFYGGNNTDPLRPDNIKEDVTENYQFCYDLSGSFIEKVNSMIPLLPIGFDMNIQKVKLTDNLIGKFGLFTIGRMLTFNPNIESLEINQNKLTHVHLYGLLIGIGDYTVKSLKYLNFAYNCLDEKSAPILIRLVKKLPHLKTIVLTMNNLRGGGAVFFNGLRNLYRKDKEIKLRNLELSNNNFPPNAIYELSKLIKDFSCRVKRLNISYSFLANPDGENFLKEVSKNRSLKYLFLYGCGINHDHVKYLTNIKKLTNVEFLKLYRNNFDLKSIIDLVSCTTTTVQDMDGIARNTLRELDLSENPPFILDKKHLEWLSKMLKVSNTEMIDLLGMIRTEKTTYNSYPQLINCRENDVAEFRKIFSDFCQNYVDLEEINKEAEQKDENSSKIENRRIVLI